MDLMLVPLALETLLEPTDDGEPDESLVTGCLLIDGESDDILHQQEYCWN